MGQAVTLNFAWVIYGASSFNPSINVRVDLSGANVSASLKKIRGIYIDNKNSNVPIYVYFPSTGYSVVAKPNSDGWFPVYTTDFVFWTIGEGFVSGAIPTTTILVTNLVNVPSINEEFGQAIALYRSNLEIIFGGGAALAFINVIPPGGQSYTSGTLVISGGGGSGALAHGTLDRFGRFTSVILDSAGGGFIGPPTVTATASHAARPAWNVNTNYATTTIVSFAGTEWVRDGANIVGAGNQPVWNGGTVYHGGDLVSASGQNYQALFGNSGQFPPTTPAVWKLIPVPDPAHDGGWTNSGSAGGTTALFSPTLGVPIGSTALFSSGYSAPALGDQGSSFVDVLTVGGVFRNNLFGSPYVSGIITVTSLHSALSFFTAVGGPAQWKVDASDGSVIWNFEFACQLGAYSSKTLPFIQQKLDATKTYRLNLTNLPGGVAPIHLVHDFNFTYSPSGF